MAHRFLERLWSKGKAGDGCGNGFKSFDPIPKMDEIASSPHSGCFFELGSVCSRLASYKQIVEEGGSVQRLGTGAKGDRECQ